MHINRKYNESRRDFMADYACEHCGHVEKSKYGYDDANFHDNVIPNMVCPECGEKATAAYSRALIPAGVVM